LESPFLCSHAILRSEDYAGIKSFDMEASLAGRPPEISGLAIPRQATMPARTDSTLNRGHYVSPFLCQAAVALSKVLLKRKSGRT
jgi:hypothetical protein